MEEPGEIVYYFLMKGVENREIRILILKVSTDTEHEWV